MSARQIAALLKSSRQDGLTNNIPYTNNNLQGGIQQQQPQQQQQQQQHQNSNCNMNMQQAQQQQSMIYNAQNSSVQYQFEMDTGQQQQQQQQQQQPKYNMPAIQMQQQLQQHHQQHNQLQQKQIMSAQQQHQQMVSQHQYYSMIYKTLETDGLKRNCRREIRSLIFFTCLEASGEWKRIWYQYGIVLIRDGVDANRCNLIEGTDIVQPKYVCGNDILPECYDESYTAYILNSELGKQYLRLFSSINSRRDSAYIINYNNMIKVFQLQSRKWKMLDLHSS